MQELNKTPATHFSLSRIGPFPIKSRKPKRRDIYTMVAIYEQNQLIGGMSASEYRRVNAVNRGVLEEIRKSPAHAKVYLECPPQSSPAMEFGSAFHTLALEPHLFESEVEVVKSRPQDPSRRLTNKVLLTEKEKPLLREMRDALYKKEIEFEGRKLSVEELFGLGKPEQTCIWRDPATGLLCKARYDFMVGSAIIDLKTCNDAFEFQRDAYNCGYHRQAAFYLNGARLISDQYKDFYFLVIEKKDPFGVRFFKASDAFLEKGREECEQNLWAYGDAIASNDWSDYPSEPEELLLPAWVK